MEKCKVLFVGVGSIAKRHIMNLKAIESQTNIIFAIDAFRRNGGLKDNIENIYQNYADVPSDYDAIFITNPTELHLSALRQFHNNGNNFFIEKPVVSVSQLEVAKSFSLRENSIYYVACPLRYNAVIQYIKKNIKPEDVISIRSISSSYLPEWRSGQDYRDTYSAHKSLGGGVSIDLIHEWDYLTYLFGWPKQVMSFIGKKSPLEIDSDDYVIYIGEYSDKIVELHLDYFGRNTIREIQLFTKDDTIIGDISNNNIHFLKSGEEIDFHVERDDFQKRELIHFMDMIQNHTTLENGYKHGINVLNITQGRLDK